MSYNLLALKNSVSFSVWPTALLGTSFNNVKVVATMDAETVRAFADVVAIHKQVYPSLPQGTPEDIDDFSFVKIQKEDGSFQYLALPWIREDTITLELTRTLRLTIANVTPDDRPRIIAALSSNGFTATEITEV